MNFTNLVMGLTAHFLIGSITGLSLNPWALLASIIASQVVGNWRQLETSVHSPVPIVVHPLG